MGPFGADQTHAQTSINEAERYLANDIMYRLGLLDDTIKNARSSFRGLLEDLHGRELSTVKEPHVSAIRMVRAAILRGAAIGIIMAALDAPRDDRASIGQIIAMLEKLDLSILADRWRTPALGATVLKVASTDWQAVLQSDDFKDCKSLRDNAIAHTLTLKSPIVQDESYFRLHDAAENLTFQVWQTWGSSAEPSFLQQHQPGLTANAKVFSGYLFSGDGKSAYMRCNLRVRR